MEITEPTCRDCDTPALFLTPDGLCCPDHARVRFFEAMRAGNRSWRPLLLREPVGELNRR